MPVYDRAGLDDEQGLAPVFPEPGQPYPEDSVPFSKSGPLDGSLQDSQLMPECKVFSHENGFATKQRGDCIKKRLENTHAQGPS